MWRSEWVDYFGHTEEELRAAFDSWGKAGNPFPETEIDARRAISAAGIDFASLRDPLGHPFALLAKREYSYARIDKVKAANAITGETQKVTISTDVVQVVRTDENGAAVDLDQVTRFSHTVSQQSGSDIAPVAADTGLFKGNTGAIGGTVADQTGAVIPGAKIRVETESGEESGTATTKDDGTYVVSDLAPGFYKVRVDANGFMSFYLTDVHVASSAMTTIDVTLRVGTASQTVTVTAGAVASLQNSIRICRHFWPRQEVARHRPERQRHDH